MDHYASFCGSGTSVLGVEPMRKELAHPSKAIAHGWWGLGNKESGSISINTSNLRSDLNDLSVP